MGNADFAAFAVTPYAAWLRVSSQLSEVANQVAFYAAYARGAAFAQGLRELLQRARRQRCALMCSEAVWWRCHRRIITDHLLAMGGDVRHIMGPGKVVPATLTRGAQICDGQVIYPAKHAA